MYSYNWSVDLGAALNRDLVRLVKWHNARAHVVHCLLNQKMGLFHHHCFSDAPVHEVDSKQVRKPLGAEVAQGDLLALAQLFFLYFTLLRLESRGKEDSSRANYLVFVLFRKLHLSE